MEILLGKLMYKRQLSIRQVSKLTGVPKSTIEDIANGRTIPRLDTLEQLAIGLKVPICSLFESPYK